MQLEFFGKPEVDSDNKYTKSISVPQYIPSDVAPTPDELCNISKYSELVANIKNSTVSEEEKAFLLKAASRHIVFNYAKIADYYAHATPEMQNLMEQSALVILDVDDAIAYGYVRLTDKMKELIDEASSSNEE